MLTFARALMSVAAATFAIASAIHFGLVIPFYPTAIGDRFIGAAVPEAVIGAALAAGVIALTALGPTFRGWLAALVTALFAAAVTVYGLSVTLGSARRGDVVYHVAVLVALLASLALLIAGRPRLVAPPRG